MACWTTTHPLPLQLDGSPIAMGEFFQHVITHNNFIWTVSSADDYNYEGLLHQFDPENGEFNKFYFNTHEDYSIHQMVGWKNMLYIFSTDYESETPNSFKIQQFNIETSTTTDFLDFQCGELIHHPQARKGSIHILEEVQEKCFLLTIDISSKTVNRTELDIENCDVRNITNLHLLVKNEQMYVFYNKFAYCVVSRIDENHKMLELSRINIGSGPYMVLNAWIDDSIVISSPERRLFRNERRTPDEWHLESYDFEKNTWRGTEANRRWELPCENPVLAAKIDQTIFALVRARTRKGARWVIAVLELEPTLTDICLQNLANEVLEENTKEHLVNSLPIGLRNPLRNLIDCRDWTAGALNDDDEDYLESESDTEEAEVAMN